MGSKRESNTDLLVINCAHVEKMMGPDFEQEVSSNPTANGDISCLLPLF